MGRIWVIPDSHGCLFTFRTLVEELIGLTHDDRLILIGDYIDRGPDSKRLLDYIIELSKEGFDVTPIRGNHEDFLVKVWEDTNKPWHLRKMVSRNKMRKDWMDSGGDTTLHSFGVVDMRMFPVKYIEWIKSLPLYVELDKFLVVHAGFNFDAPDIFADEQAMMWIRDYTIDPEKTNFRRVIHGHVPVPLDFIHASLESGTYHFIALDNGVYMINRPGFGNLLALELNSLKLLVQPNLDM
jgi:serine/threonine protein phosphatase 1